MLCGQAACAWAVNLPWIALSGQVGMFPLMYLTSFGIVNVVVFGDCDVAKSSKAVELIVCSEIPLYVSVSGFEGVMPPTRVCRVGVADAVPEKASIPVPPATAGIRSPRFRIPPRLMLVI